MLNSREKIQSEAIKCDNEYSNAIEEFKKAKIEAEKRDDEYHNKLVEQYGQMYLTYPLDNSLLIIFYLLNKLLGPSEFTLNETKSPFLHSQPKYCSVIPNFEYKNNFIDVSKLVNDFLETDETKRVNYEKAVNESTAKERNVKERTLKSSLNKKQSTIDINLDFDNSTSPYEMPQSNKNVTSTSFSTDSSKLNLKLKKK
jgi:hypothetical protein